MPFELPVAGTAAPRERGDAARNRARVAEARLEAFLRALVDHMEQELDLIFAVDQLGGFGSGPYAAWHLHVRVLATEVAPGFDPEWIADALLAPLHPSLYR